MAWAVISGPFIQGHKRVLVFTRIPRVLSDKEGMGVSWSITGFSSV